MHHVWLFQDFGSNSRLFCQFFDLDVVMGRICAANRAAEDQLRPIDAGDDHHLAGGSAFISSRFTPGVVYQALALSHYHPERSRRPEQSAGTRTK